jgi:hypothetical protein
MNASGARISALTKELAAQWQQTRDHWLDAKSQEFERKYLEDLRSAVDSSMTVFEKLDSLLAKIRKDCE